MSPVEGSISKTSVSIVNVICRNIVVLRESQIHHHYNYISIENVICRRIGVLHIKMKVESKKVVILSSGSQTSRLRVGLGTQD